MLRKKKHKRKSSRPKDWWKVFRHNTESMIHKRKNICKLDLIKIKKDLLCKRHIRRMKRETTGWEKLFANHVPDKGFIHWLCKVLSNSTVKNHSNRKWSKDMKRHFTKEDIQMASKYMKYVHYHWSLGKCKLRTRWALTSHLLEQTK